MKNRRLFLLVEGPNDKSFFERIVKPWLNSIYEKIEIRPYSAWSNGKKTKFIKSLRAKGFRCVYLRDFDEARCVTKKKDEIINAIKINRNDVKIVKAEIESWYIAGASDNFLRRYGIRIGTNTESIDKEKLDSHIPFKMEKTLFMLQILEDFSISEAIRRNRSFDYLLKCLK